MLRQGSASCPDPFIPGERAPPPYSFCRRTVGHQSLCERLREEGILDPTGTGFFCFKNWSSERAKEQLNEHLCFVNGGEFVAIKSSVFIKRQKITWGVRFASRNAFLPEASLLPSSILPSFFVSFLPNPSSSPLHSFHLLLFYPFFCI
jgi:hypothetical protein